jgi:hypothetical protein
MTAHPIESEPTTAPGADVRLCQRCGRPLPALHKNEYTPTRARLVATTGFCVCPPGGSDDVARIPDHSPSLL